MQDAQVRKIGITTGFKINAIRRNAYRKLLKYTGAHSSVKTDYKNQIKLDVDRAFNSNLNHRNDLLLLLLTTCSNLHYFQGLHDICSSILDIFPLNEAKDISLNLAYSHLLDFMQDSISFTLPYLHLVTDIIKSKDPILYNHIYSDTCHIWCISWIITLFQHTESTYKLRILDFIVSAGVLSVCFISAQLLIDHRLVILQLSNDVGSLT